MRMTTQSASDNHESSEGSFRRHLGFWQLTAVAFGGVIGSGWLLSPMHAAAAAGPASLITWVVGGLALVLIALVMVELGATMPVAGGLVRWPLFTSGRLVATLVGTGIWIAYATNPPSESAAMLQYMSKYVPGLFSGGRLTTLGVLLGLAFMAVFVALNWFGVKLFAHVNLAVTIAKFAVPALTVVMLLATGFHAHNVTGAGHGGFAPYGYSAPLSAIATAGVIYAYTGFQGPIDLAAEARNPRRDIPRAVLTALLLSMVLYIALQLAFLGAVPGADLIHGWHGVDFDSPFAELATSLNLTWLSWVLYAARSTAWAGTGCCRGPSPPCTPAPACPAVPCCSTSWSARPSCCRSATGSPSWPPPASSACSRTRSAWSPRPPCAATTPGGWPTGSAGPGSSRPRASSWPR
jgi:amino acid transporter